MLFQRHKLPKSALLLIFHIFLLYLHSEFVTNIWPNSIFGMFQFCFTYEKFHPRYIKKDKCGEGTFELVRVRLTYFARLLNKSKTCSSQVTSLTSSIYLLVIFFYLYSPHKLAAPAHFHPAWAPLGALFCGDVLRERGREKEQGLGEAGCPCRGAEDKTCLSCCSLPGTAVAGTLSMACPLQGLR